MTPAAARQQRGTRAVLAAVWLHAGARVRLTLIYAGLFLVTGALLLAVNDGLVQQQLNSWQQHKAVLREQLASHPASAVNKSAPAANPAALPLPATTPSPSPDSAIAASVAMQAGQQSALHEAEQAVLTDSLLTLAVMTAAAGLLGWLMAGRVLRPVHLVSAAARRLSERDLHQRIPAAGPRDEMHELADTFNDMLARLDRAFAAQRAFIANASHELRTPIAMNRALAEVTLDRPATSGELRALASDVLEVAQQQEITLNGLLALARSQHGIETYLAVDLAATTRRALTSTAAEHSGHHLTLDARLETAIVPGSPALADLLVTNLIRNAFRHNIDGGAVRVRTHGTTLTVENTGPVFTGDDITRLCEPFRRGTSDRTGTSGAGLGLPIILAAADAHHATVRLTARLGGGLQAEVTFPSREQT